MRTVNDRSLILRRNTSAILNTAALLGPPRAEELRCPKQSVAAVRNWPISALTDRRLRC